MATNSGSSNPIGHKTGPVTDSVPPVSLETLTAIKAAASAEILAPHRRLSTEGAQEREKEDLPIQKGSGTGDEITERTK